VLNKRTLMLEGVTLAEVVELVVEVFVDLAGGAVLHQQTAEDAETAHPHDLAVTCVSLRSIESPLQSSRHCRHPIFSVAAT
jgi:hypothetical protein